MQDADIVIIGAGAAGLMAARRLLKNKKKVVVLEGRDRAGGRINTIGLTGFTKPVEEGAEFIHGKLPLTLNLLKKAGISYKKSSGQFWNFKDGNFYQRNDLAEHHRVLMKKLKKQKKDVSVDEFLTTQFTDSAYKNLKDSVRRYVEGYYAATIEKGSTHALREELEGSDKEQYRIEGGYGGLIRFLYTDCLKKGCTIELSKEATTVEWQKNKVQVHTKDGDVYKANKVIITVPLGVLQTPAGSAGAIRFTPAIDDRLTLFQELGFGAAIKILMEFDEPFWQNGNNLDKLSFLFSEEEISTWWTQYPEQSSLLTGWCTGRSAEVIKDCSDNELLQKGLASLSLIFSLPVAQITAKLKGSVVCNWAADPFTRGGYSYTSVAAKGALKLINKPVDNTLFFAGEGLHEGIEIGTVEAALQTGKRAAEKILRSS